MTKKTNAERQKLYRFRKELTSWMFKEILMEALHWKDLEPYEVSFELYFDPSLPYPKPYKLPRFVAQQPKDKKCS